MRSPQARWFIAAAGFSCANAYAAIITPVLVTGRPAAGLSNYNYDGQINSIHLNDAGLVSVVVGARQSGSIDIVNGYWGGTPGNLQVHVLEHAQAPGLPAGWTLEDVTGNLYQNIATDGRITFGASVRDPVTRNRFFSLWVGPLGSPAMVARASGPAYGVPGATYTVTSGDMRYFSSPESGRVVFAAGLSGPGIDNSNDYGLWEGPTGSPALLFREGQQAPGLPDGVVFDYFNWARSSPNGNISFEAGVRGPGVTPQVNSYVRYSGSFSNPKLVFRSGIPAPGIPPGVVFSQNRFDNIHPNDAGGEVLIASVSGPGVTQDNDEGFWFGNGDSLPLVAREGAQAPGLAPGVLFTSVSDTIYPDGTPFLAATFNNRSEVAFSAHFSGGGADGWGLWAGPIGNLKLIVKDGDPAPEFPSNARFSFTTGSAPFWQILMNDNGQVAFTATTSNGRTGLFATDPVGNLHYIASTSEFLSVGDGQQLLAGNLWLYDFNNLNEVAFIANFTNGVEGAFVANVPEPASPLALCCLLPLFARRRKT